MACSRTAILTLVFTLRRNCGEGNKRPRTGGHVLSMPAKYCVNEVPRVTLAWETLNFRVILVVNHGLGGNLAGKGALPPDLQGVSHDRPL